MTSQNDIANWFRRGQEQGATHLIVVCDTFSHEDYPVYVMPGQRPMDVAGEYGKDAGNGLPTLPNDDMQKVMEVYALHLDMEAQLTEGRAFHFDDAPAH